MSELQALPVPLGEMIGVYRLESVLGHGGMGCVYAASHSLLGRKVAVKVLRQEYAADQEYVSRFFYEAKVVNDVRHPNIIDVIDFIVTDHPRRVACVMEYVGGRSLSALLREGPLTFPQAINLAIQLVDALAAVHAVGIVHRDLKPGNILVIGDRTSDFSDPAALKVLDFGIAKVDGAKVAHKTATGIILGTPAYMAPEQVFGEPVSPATDVYAAGEIIYEMLARKRMYAGDASAILRAKTSEKTQKLWFPPELPKKAVLRSMINRCVAYNAGARPELPELRSLLAGMVPPLPPPATIPSSRFEEAPNILANLSPSGWRTRTNLYAALGALLAAGAIATFALQPPKNKVRVVVPPSAQILPADPRPEPAPVKEVIAPAEPEPAIEEEAAPIEKQTAPRRVTRPKTKEPQKPTGRRALDPTELPQDY